jgi:transposase
MLARGAAGVVDLKKILSELMPREFKDASQVRCLLALAAIYDGATRAEAAEVGGVTRQTIRDWVLRFNAHGPKGAGRSQGSGTTTAAHQRHPAALVAAIDSGPIPAVHGVVRWRIIDLCQWLWDEFQVAVSEQTLGRVLRAMEYRELSARPRHQAQAIHARGREYALTHYRRLPVPLCRRSPLQPSAQSLYGWLDRNDWREVSRAGPLCPLRLAGQPSMPLHVTDPGDVARIRWRKLLLAALCPRPFHPPRSVPWHAMARVPHRFISTISSLTRYS